MVLAELVDAFVTKGWIEKSEKHPESIGSIAVGKNAWWFYPEWTGGKKYESAGKIGMITLWAIADSE